MSILFYPFDMIDRIIKEKILSLAQKFPVIAIVGPRQSGKTTLAQATFPDKPYVLLEKQETREYAQQDPKGFLAQYPNGAVFDEVQRSPGLFSYLQGIVDQNPQAGQFILSGSQHFLMLENISQTLAGRIAIVQLLPFSLEEISSTPYLPADYETLLFKGFYPRLYDRDIDPIDWYPNYIQTYIERDLRQIKNIHDLSAFHKFLTMCAARTGQILNLSSLANDCGITHNTANAWISLLETSFIVYRLEPFYENFHKRLIKAPKLHFYDTGLVCSLLKIENHAQLQTHALKGNIFETFVISEMLKYRLHRGLAPNLYYWRDKTGHEIDGLYVSGDRLTTVEIKSGKTVAGDFFQNTNYFQDLAAGRTGRNFIVYGGDSSQERSDATVLSWKNISRIFSE